MKMLKKQQSNLKSTLIVIFAVAVITGFALIYSVSSGSNKAIYSQSDCKSTCVALQQDMAMPDTVAVPVGSYVQFNSADGKSHNLSFGQGGEEHGHSGKFYSGEFKSDEAWRVQFNDEGSFVFHDHLNPKISVLVVVYAPDKEYKVQ